MFDLQWSNEIISNHIGGFQPRNSFEPIYEADLWQSTLLAYCVSRFCHGTSCSNQFCVIGLLNSLGRCTCVLSAVCKKTWLDHCLSGNLSEWEKLAEIPATMAQLLEPNSMLSPFARKAATHSAPAYKRCCRVRYRGLSVGFVGRFDCLSEAGLKLGKEDQKIDAV